MKKLFFLLIWFVAIGNFALASSVDDITVGTLEKQDSQAIFGENDMNQQISLLNAEQMDEIQAQGWFRRIFTPSNIMRAVSVIAYFYPPTATASIGFGNWWNTYTVGYRWAF
ncbi:MAG: hypothetical protein KN64_05045 [Sulfurovum sp. AS07-7]|nr:MAG: hypothetical protein KN64_05045 [Sulfurovum sp. AS07-7]